jgi:hypothetical protein
MGMAMTILSVSMLYRLTGLPASRFQAAELNPVRLYQRADQTVRKAWRRGAVIYQNIRLLYQIQSRLPSLSTEEETPETAAPKRGAEAEERR